MLFAGNPDGSRIVSEVIVFTVLCTIFVALRAWVRLKIQKAFYLDDWMAVFTLYVSIGQIPSRI